MTAQDRRTEAAPDPATQEALIAWFNTLPVNRMLGVRCVGLLPTGAVVEVEVADQHRNPDGHVSGAITAGAIDVAAGIAVTGTTGLDSVTGDLGLSYLAPVRTGPLRIEVEILKAGRRTCVPHARLYDAAGRLCVVGTGTWMMSRTPLRLP